jgi:AraC-like DNA-binding protein
MKPLVLHDIAEAVGMHESTISRVTTQKFMHTPRGIYEPEILFLQPRQHLRRRRMLVHGDPRDHQETGAAENQKAIE